MAPCTIGRKSGDELPFHIVVMGVAGCGKSTVGQLLADRLGAAFIDGDDLHPASNRRKMASGQPLDDDDRWPWLDLIADSLNQAHSTRGVVVAASALRRKYRERILKRAPGTFFVHLHGEAELLHQRLEARKNHFMKPEMLESQLATLELLEPDEPGEVFNIKEPVEKLVESVYRRLTD